MDDFRLNGFLKDEQALRLHCLDMAVATGVASPISSAQAFVDYILGEDAEVGEPPR